MAKTYYPKEKRPDTLAEWKEYNLVFDLLNALALARNTTTVALLLRDLLTPKEIRNIAKRLQIAKMILAGEKYDEIADYLACSLSTVSKVKIWLDTGGQGLTNIILQLPKRKRKPGHPGGIPGYRLPQLLLYGAKTLSYEREERKLKTFLDRMAEKGIIDKNIREQLAEEYREKWYEERKAAFRKKVSSLRSDEKLGRTDNKSNVK